MKKTICTGLAILLLAVASVKPESKDDKNSKSGITSAIVTTLAYPFKKGASTLKFATNTIQDLISFNTANNLFLTAKEATKLSLYLLAVVATVYGLDAAILWTTKIGIPKTIFNTYEFGTIYNKLTPTIKQRIKFLPKCF
ncbi:hypothetical protein KAT08_03000 [Candidatus Babeliales bacterium]|nr:hypothetical protein [Candidatus Babeliales bacterium]